MKRLTQILRIYHTADFVNKNNSSGQTIDFTKEGYFTIQPVNALLQTLQSLQGSCVVNNHFTQLLLPLDFDSAPPQSSINRLPDELIFFVTASNSKMLLWSGLQSAHKILFLQPGGGVQEFLFNHKKLSCRPCGKNPVITNADLLPTLPSAATYDDLQKLIGSPLGDAFRSLNIKVEVDGVPFLITGNESLQQFQKHFSTKKYQPVHFVAKRGADDVIIIDLPAVLLVDEQLPRNCIGVVSVPTALLDLSDTEPANYPGKNCFILHFSTIKPDVHLVLFTKQFANGASLFLNESQLNPDVQDEASMPSYKRLTVTINQHPVLLDSHDQLIIESDSKKYVTPINALNTYQPKTNSSTIIITK